MGSGRRVLFLCTGNYYRSRYAEEIFNHHARREGLAWVAFSRAAAEKCWAGNVGPMSPFALKALAAKGISAEGAGRYPMPCGLADFEGTELVVALKEAEHRPLIERRFPDMASRIEYWDVDDIEFLDAATALPKIDELVGRLIRILQNSPDESPSEIIQISRNR